MRQKWYLRTENLKNHTLSRCTYLYSPYMGVTPGNIHNWTYVSLHRYYPLCLHSAHTVFHCLSTRIQTVSFYSFLIITWSVMGITCYKCQPVPPNFCTEVKNVTNCDNEEQAFPGMKYDSCSTIRTTVGDSIEMNSMQCGIKVHVPYLFD